MSKSVKNVIRIVLLCLCVALLMTNTLIHASEVEAASDTNKTETNLTLTEDTPSAEDDELTHRAITMDEAKKEAQAAVSEQLAEFHFYRLPLFRINLKRNISRNILPEIDYLFA